MAQIADVLDTATLQDAPEVDAGRFFSPSIHPGSLLAMLGLDEETNLDDLKRVISLVGRLSLVGVAASDLHDAQGLLLERREQLGSVRVVTRPGSAGIMSRILPSSATGSRPSSAAGYRSGSIPTCSSQPAPPPYSLNAASSCRPQSANTRRLPAMGMSRLGLRATAIPPVAEA